MHPYHSRPSKQLQGPSSQRPLKRPPTQDPADNRESLGENLHSGLDVGKQGALRGQSGLCVRCSGYEVVNLQCMGTHTHTHACMHARTHARTHAHRMHLSEAWAVLQRTAGEHSHHLLWTAHLHNVALNGTSFGQLAA